MTAIQSLADKKLNEYEFEHYYPIADDIVISFTNLLKNMDES